VNVVYSILLEPTVTLLVSRMHTVILILFTFYK